MQPQRIEPGPGQESVWDYPRPPRVERSKRRVKVVFAGSVVADSERALRVCETAGPPVYYVPPEDVLTETLHPVEHSTYCEWKGTASYYDLIQGTARSSRAAWAYQAPTGDYTELTGYIAFYPSRVDAVYLDDELVTPQPGDFYGGWITAEIVGPFNGEAGSSHW